MGSQESQGKTKIHVKTFQILHEPAGKLALRERKEKTEKKNVAIAAKPSKFWVWGFGNNEERKKNCEVIRCFSIAKVISAVDLRNKMQALHWIEQ